MDNTVHNGENVPLSPRFSVVVIAYNSEPFLVEAVESALAQDLPDVEVIVVDDGSRVPVSEILPASVLLRCVVIRRDNGGIAAARNTGIRACRSPFVALLDGDDCMLPGHARLAMQCFHAHPGIDVVVPDAYILARGMPRCTVKHSQRYPRSHAITFENFVRGISPLAGWSTLRRSCFDRYCYLDEEFRNGGEDFHHFAKLLALGAQFRYLPQPSYEYRRHDGSITYSKPIHMGKCILRAIEKLTSEPIFTKGMLALLDDYRMRTNQSLAWYQFKDSFTHRDYQTAAYWMPFIRGRFLPGPASRFKFYCAVLFLQVLMRLRPSS
jgi:glycosyltransferase involved in cell wall biosynthesis